MTGCVTGQVELVTGAGSGIGRAGAIAMAREGALVVATDLDAEFAAEIADTIMQAADRSEWHRLDVRDDIAFEAMVTGVAERLGRSNLLHSHADIQVAGALEDVTPDQMDASWQFNVQSHFVLCRAVLPVMRMAGNGSVIVTTSNSGCQYDREMINYSTTKHAAVAIVRQMPADYARENIRFNALCSSFVDTPFNTEFKRQMGGRNMLEQYIAHGTPMGRWVELHGIADGIGFLTSSRSSFVTGLALVIDGAEILQVAITLIFRVKGSSADPAIHVSAVIGMNTTVGRLCSVIFFAKYRPINLIALQSQTSGNTLPSIIG